MMPLVVTWPGLGQPGRLAVSQPTAPVVGTGPIVSLGADVDPPPAGVQAPARSAAASSAAARTAGRLAREAGKGVRGRTRRSTARC